MQGLVLHLAYGAGAGALFGLLARDWSGDDATEEARGAALGTIYGLLLSAFGVRVVLNRVLGVSLDADERFVFHVTHVVYGLVLGTYVGSRIDRAASDDRPNRGRR